MNDQKLSFDRVFPLDPPYRQTESRPRTDFTHPQGLVYTIRSPSRKLLSEQTAEASNDALQSGDIISTTSGSLLSANRDKIDSTQSLNIVQEEKEMNSILSQIQSSVSKSASIHSMEPRSRRASIRRRGQDSVQTSTQSINRIGAQTTNQSMYKLRAGSSQSVQRTSALDLLLQNAPESVKESRRGSRLSLNQTSKRPSIAEKHPAEQLKIPVSEQAEPKMRGRSPSISLTTAAETELHLAKNQTQLNEAMQEHRPSLEIKLDGSQLLSPTYQTKPAEEDTASRRQSLLESKRRSSYSGQSPRKPDTSRRASVSEGLQESASRPVSPRLLAQAMTKSTSKVDLDRPVSPTQKTRSRSPSSVDLAISSKVPVRTVSHPTQKARSPSSVDLSASPKAPFRPVSPPREEAAIPRTAPVRAVTPPKTETAKHELAEKREPERVLSRQSSSRLSVSERRPSVTLQRSPSRDMSQQVPQCSPSRDSPQSKDSTHQKRDSNASDTKDTKPDFLTKRLDLLETQLTSVQTQLSSMHLIMQEKEHKWHLKEQQLESRIQELQSQDTLAQKVDLDVLKELVKHIATKQDIQESHKQVQSMVFSKLSPEYMKQHPRSRTNQLMREWSKHFSDLVNQMVEQRFAEIERKMEERFEKMQLVIDEPHRNMLLQKTYQLQLAELEKRLTAFCETSTQKQTSKPIDRQELLIQLRKEQELYLETQIAILKNDQETKLLQNTPLSGLLNDIKRELDEKLYHLCADVTNCRSMFERQLDQPFYRTGQWHWTSGKLVQQTSIPWNTETCNTDPTNFKWQQNTHIIKIREGGLYEIAFSIFTKSKPSLQVVVNGESVLSAINSPSYVVRHSNGLIMDGDGKLQYGSVTGLSLLDFMHLPPKSQVSIHFFSKSKEPAHGFLQLKRL
ncbi:hypothetical protein EDD86DRAFT_201253, partial [Gorgonomyces haynaldii]